MATCSGCLSTVNTAWRFCRSCGQALRSDSANSEASLEALLPSEVLMYRVSPKEMQGLISKTLLVEEGYGALLFVGGKHDATLSAGKHSFGNLLASSFKDVTVAVYRTSDLSLEVSTSGLLSSDPLPLTLDYRLIVKIENPLLFWINLASGTEGYSLMHLSAAIHPLVEDSSREFAAGRTIHGLAKNSSTRSELQDFLTSELIQPFSRLGIRLIMLQALGIRCHAWDRVNEALTEFVVQAAEEQAVLEGRKRLFDVHTESDIQELSEGTSKVLAVEKRVALWDRLRQALIADARGSIRSRLELEEMLRQADKEQLLRQDEHDTLVRTLEEASEDHELARAHLLRRTEAEREFEIQKLRMGYRYGMEQERLAMEVGMARQEVEAKLQIELREVELGLSRERLISSFRREQELQEDEAQGRRQLGAARTSADIEAITRRQDAEDIGMALEAYGQYKQLKREDLFSREMAQLESEERRLQMQLDAEKQQLEMRLRESRERHEHELKRIEALSSAGIETLIAVSGPEQSRLLAQLARTRALSGCSPQEILAMQAGDNPHLAQALKEVLTATAAAGQLEQYERLVSEIKDSAAISREECQRNLKTMTEMFNKALDSVRDTAIAFSGQGPTPSVFPQQA